uniref:Uncharacterized protein n=1 Tax=Tanacetum cinerariifolium TaxID=118510 RepID=A0A699I8R9_TANCI|nr:hypothetical protein [Tanacetum cinerariifolium]
MLAQSAVVEGEGSKNPLESQPTPSLAQPISEFQILESSTSPQNTQSPRKTLEGTSFPYTRGPNFLDPSIDVEAVHKEEAKEISSLQKRVTKLEQRQCSRILGFHPFKAGTSRRHSLDKGKDILQEPKPMKKTKKIDKDQIKRDAKVSLKIQPDLDEEVKKERERQEEASKAALAELYDEVQLQIDVDHELAARLTYKEQEKYTVEERSKLLAEFFKRIKREFTHAQLKSRSFKEIQKLYTKEQKWIDAFVLIDSDKELRKWLKVVPDDDKAINYETLDVKSLIVDYESQELGTIEAGGVHVYKLTRLDGSYRHFSTFSRMLEVLDRQDVLDLHMIVTERFPANDPEGYDLILWGDLKTLMESSEDDEI